MDDVVIVGAVRTAVGKFGGTLAKIPAPRLGAAVIQALLARTGVKADAVSEVLLGQVLAAGSGQNPARQAGIFAGLKKGVEDLDQLHALEPRIRSLRSGGHAFNSPVFQHAHLRVCGPCRSHKRKPCPNKN